jgi:hypothetical protein
MSTVFISYRRDNTAGEARALSNDLISRLGENSVFMDVDSIALGRDFRSVLQETTASCDLMLVLIGKNWADAKDESGRTRLENPEDYVRLEIEAALKRNIPVTPVLVQGAQMPGPEQLPIEIRDLGYRNGFEISNNRWGSDVREMMRRLGLEKGRPPFPTPQSSSKRWRVWVPILALIIAVTSGGGLFINHYWSNLIWHPGGQSTLPPISPPTVLGGTSSSIADWPWLVSVYTAGQFICNGTLIAPRMVLSTALCVGGGQPANYEVATATDDAKYVRVGGRIPVTKIFVHPAFSKDASKNDIAILELGVALPPPFATISAQRSADPKTGTLALVAAVDFRSQPGNLLQTAIPIADDATCAGRYGDKSAREGTICAGFERGGASACPGTGSAGGPLVVLSGAGRKYQIGIVSLADDCSVPGAAYGLYTRVSSYADWIKQVVPNVLSEPMTGVKR